MNSYHPYVAALLLAALTAGCGDSTRSKSRSSTASAVSSAAAVTSGGASAISSQTTAATLTGHGDIVMIPTLTGGQVMGFLPDGQVDALEVTDAAALEAQGARLGTTLTVDADVVTNVGGSSALAEAITLATFEIDDVATYGTLVQDASGSVLFKSVDGGVYLPSGPQAKALSAHPVGRPLFLSGERKSSTLIGNRKVSTLDVTAWRPTSELTLSVTTRGRLRYGVQTLRILDVERRGAYRLSRSLGKQVSSGKGLLPLADLASLQQEILTADLRSASPSYGTIKKVFPRFLAPLPKVLTKTTTITGSDAKGTFVIRIGSKAKLPVALQAVVSRLTKLATDAPRSRILAKGRRSKIRKAATQVATDARAFAALWRSHSSQAFPAKAFFKNAFVVGAFAGETPRGSVEIDQVERLGDDLYVTTRRSRILAPKIKKPGIRPLPLFFRTAPFAFAQIDKRGATGRIFVDGKRVFPTRRFPPIKPLPKLPFLVKKLAKRKSSPGNTPKAKFGIFFVR